MHVSGFTVDLNWFLQFIVTAFVVAVGLLYLVKNTASNYFAVDANFDSSEHPAAVAAAALMPGVIAPADTCVVCGNETSKHCSGCKIVRYCSEACQRSHWFSGHNAKCKRKVNLQQNRGQNAVALIAARGPSKISNQPEKILFPYDEFLELFNWEKPGFPPCGLLNCGNSCFANVVLQCLAYTRPLVAYLLKKGHQRECRRDDWCFLCELQNHVARASQSRHAFSPINILSRLPNIGGNLGYGKQEDAHEFMRFAIDTMQSISLDEFGGEKAVHPSAQETTLIQHIFGGQLQSQVICTKCNNVSDQFENMMDLTVEIHGDASSLEECLDQFTDKECLHGDNKYKCDGCNDYVLAWKRLTIRRAPNILTVALKRFQTGRFGKLNKRVTFPETLDLSPYMSGAGDGNDVYKLYAVVVHVDMLNASFFGHYICYTKDFSGNWYRIDDCKVCPVELDEVLSQGAYMLLYSRVCARQSCLNFTQESSRKGQKLLEVSQEVLPIKRPAANCSSAAEESIEPATSVSGSLLSKFSRQETDFRSEDQMSSVSVDVREQDIVNLDASTLVSMDIEAADGDGRFDTGEATSSVEYASSKLVTGANPVNFNVFHVENGNRAEENVPEGISVNSSTETDNHVREKLENCVGGADGANSSGPKLKPIFAPGFLGKCPRDRYAKSDVKAQSEVGELDMDASTSVSMDTDAYGDGTGEPTSSVEYACNKLVTGADPVNFTVCQAENGNGAEENGVSEGISVNSLIEIDNHVREKEKNNVAGVNSSGPKWKPIFAPGFLGKYPLNRYAKSDVKAQSEVGEVDMNASTSVSMDIEAHGDGSFDTGANPVNFNISHAENGNEAEENGVVAEGVSVNSLTETDNCVREKVRNSTSKAENHVGRVDVVSSGPKLKPIFAPGFLGKRPRDRYAKSDMKAQAKVDLLSHQNGQRLIKHEGKPNLKHEGKPNLKYIASTSMPMGTEELGSMTDIVATLGITSALDGESDKQIG